MKIVTIIVFVILAAVFIYLQLLKGVVATGGIPFAVGNILKVSLFFLIVVPTIFLIQKLIKKNDRNNS